MNDFNRRRRMFAIVDGQVRIAPPEDPRSHIEWFRAEGWVTFPHFEEFELIVRGFSDGRRLIAYRGTEFSFAGVPAAISPHLEALKTALDLPDDTQVFYGAKPAPGGGMDGRREAGEIEELIERAKDAASTDQA